ncbi:phosphopyruvate hydratase [Candidatus Micrarchaeota archaeon]|nr:phosphopyruvate hydratase [Candidatus Micrarchaeota archaeon]
MKITEIKGREIIDSRGNPTVEVEVSTEKGRGKAAAPSGASRGVHEAWELRDGGKRFHGKGVLNAVRNVNELIAKELMGRDVQKQEELDKLMIELDETENKKKLGGNAMIAVSMAVLKCAANEKGEWLYEHLGGRLMPRPMLNIINGGQHAGSGLEIQEFMIVPEEKEFREGLRYSAEIYQTLKENLVKKYGRIAKGVGDEGGFAPPMKETREALDEIVKAVEENGYGGKVKLSLDCAASSFYEEGKYRIDGKKMEKEELLDYYLGLIKEYPIISIEDPFYEENFEDYAELTKKSRIQIVGDDLVVTNPKRISMAIEKGSMNALLLKVNQIGTVTEAMEAATMVNERGMGIIVSHRSGETEDDFIADFSVGINAGQIKTGAPARGERTAKYNQLLRIEERIGK